MVRVCARCGGLMHGVLLGRPRHRQRRLLQIENVSIRIQRSPYSKQYEICLELQMALFNLIEWLHANELEIETGVIAKGVNGNRVCEQILI